MDPTTGIRKSVHVELEDVRPLPVLDTGSRLKLNCIVPGIVEETSDALYTKG